MITFESVQFNPRLVLQKDYPNREIWLRELFRENMKIIKPTDFQRALMDEDSFIEQTYKMAEAAYQKEVEMGIINPRRNFVEAAQDAMIGMFTTPEERLGANIYYGIQRYGDPEFVNKVNTLIPNFKADAIKALGDRTYLYSENYIISLGDNAYQDAYIERITPEEAWHYMNFGELI